MKVKGGIVKAALLGGVASASGVALTATSGWLIVRAAERPVILTLLTAIVAVRTFGIARPVFRYWERLASHDAALASLAARRSAAYGRLVPLTPARLGRRRRTDVLTTVVHDLTDEAEAAVRVTVPIASASIAAGLAVALTSALVPAVGWVLAGLALSIAAVCAAALRLESASLPTLLAARADVNRVSELVTAQADELRAIGAWPTALRWLDDAHGQLAGATRRASRGRAFVSGALLALTGAATAAVAWLVVGLDVSAPVKALLLLTPVALADAITPLPEAVRARANARAAAGRTAELLAQSPAVTSSGHEFPPTGEPQHGGLSLTDVFAEWQPRPIGRGHDVGPISLDLPAGSNTAIVGPNGSGKSTLLAVLARQLDPVAGRYEATTPGHGPRRDVLAEPLAESRSRIALVDDETHLFATTLRGNLTLARPGADDDDLMQALRAAGLGQLITSLPQGLDTVLGHTGRALSGGERARLGIARALVSERPVLLLDEPVAHLDPPTARLVLDDVLHSSHDRTVVLVTHRTEGLGDADRIIELGQRSNPDTQVD